MATGTCSSTIQGAVCISSLIVLTIHPYTSLTHGAMTHQIHSTKPNQGSRQHGLKTSLLPGASQHPLRASRIGGLLALRASK